MLWANFNDKNVLNQNALKYEHPYGFIWFLIFLMDVNCWNYYSLKIFFLTKLDLKCLFNWTVYIRLSINKKITYFRIF